MAGTDTNTTEAQNGHIGGNGDNISSARVYTPLVSHVSAVYVADSGGNMKKGNLFMNGLYYLQNSLSAQTDDEKERSLYSKALLYLHTIPFNYENIANGEARSFFNSENEKHGGKEAVPYGVLVLIGGLIWRKRWSESHNGTDPIRFNEATNQPFKRPTAPYTPLLADDGNGHLVFCVGPSNSSFSYSTEYGKIVNEHMDLYTENRLVEEFTLFASNTFQKKVMRACELECIEFQTDTQPSQPTIGTGTPTYNRNQSESDPNYFGTPKPIDYYRFYVIQNRLKSLKSSLVDMLGCLGGRDTVPMPDGASELTVTNFPINYSMGFWNESDNMPQTFFSDTNIVHEVFSNLYRDISYAMTVGHNVKGEKCEGFFKKKYYQDYLDGFVNVLGVYAKKQSDKDRETALASSGRSEGTVSEREMRMAVYMELKNIWDRWLCGYYNADTGAQDADSMDRMCTREYFDVKPKDPKVKYQDTLYGNFVFINSFYEDISHRFKLNCEKLLHQFDSDVKETTGDGGKNRVNIHLGNVVSAHKCIFFAFPDYVGFDSSSWDKVKKNMEDMFLPVPSSKVPMPSVMNKFVVIYANFATTPEDGDLKFKSSGFNSDTFNIYSYKDGTSIAPSVFNSKSLPGRNPEKSRIGYAVPAFCVEYSRQTNTYWLSMGVSMESNANTQAAAMAYANIAEKGNSSKRQVCFYGQDLYPIYNAYSYSVTIEMMGDAQIQPLMYFQLLNIPMFNGAYMVTQVEHEIKPGVMKTIIKGTKISRVRVPDTEGWFSTPIEGDAADVPVEIDFADDGGTVMTATSGDVIDIADENLAKAINSQLGKQMNCDAFVKAVFGSEGIEVAVGHSLQGVPTNMFREMDSGTEWDVYAFARTPKKADRWKAMYSGNAHPKCGDLLFTYHDDVHDTDNDDFHHVAIFLGFAAEGSSDMFVAEGLTISGNRVQDKDNTVHVCRLQDSRIGLSSDVTTHWARCKKYKVRQKGDMKEDTDIRIVHSDVSEADVNDNTWTSQPPYASTQVVGISQWSVVNNGIGTRYAAPKPHYTLDDMFTKHYVKTDKKNLGVNENYVTNDNFSLREPMQNLIDNVLNGAVDRFIGEYGINWKPSQVTKGPNITHGYRNRTKPEDPKMASQHYYGEAADLQFGRTEGHRMLNLAFACAVVKNGNFDQMILEDTNAPGFFLPGVIHVSYGTRKKRGGKNQRCEVRISSDYGKTFTRTYKPGGGANNLEAFLAESEVKIAEYLNRF